jgi:hypothetical protein
VNEEVIRVSFYGPGLSAASVTAGALLGMIASWLSLRNQLVEG